MRVCWVFWLKMLRYTSRLNIVLVIVCLGAVFFMWNRCQIGQFERHIMPVAVSNTLDCRGLDGDQRGKIESRQDYDTNKGNSDQKIDLFGKESEENGEGNDMKETKEEPLPYKNIDVVVNDDTKIQGRLENMEVYIPFSFIRDYFEIEGKIVQDEFGKQFHVRHTSYEYFTPETDTYDPHGSFLWFVNYNVEGRPRVKCITGVDEVPVSTQWGEEGYRYPIQIAQYGLSHYSMLLKQSKDIVKVVDDCEKSGAQEWVAEGKGAYVKNVYDSKQMSRVMEFRTNDSPDNFVSLQLGSSSKTYVLSFDIFFKSSGTISVKVEVGDTKIYTLFYDTSETLMETHKSAVTYGVGLHPKWRRITRNLWTDLNKAFGERRRKKENKKRGKLRITEIQSLTLQGDGFIDNITLMENGHKAAFLASARWLLKNQDEKGAWPIPVKRKLKTGAELKPNWYSAMAQGQALSVLTRAYHLTKDLEFLKAARRATGLFRVKSEDNGILAVFMNKFKWYEEYPMTPSLFVLNGFLYSLMGLFDLKMTLRSEQRSEAESLFKDGMTSLRAMILMYDTGSGTIYDLRHLTMDAEPNLARWDYHATHVNQLTWVTMIDSDPFYKNVLKRWQGYFKGVKAKHN